jgi:DNA primase large subunit
MDFEFTPEEMVQLVPKALNYTKKMQQIAPYRKRISAMEEENITDEQFNLAMSVLKGDRDAISQVLKEHEIDNLDLDVENSKYVPKDYGRTETELEIDDIVNDISRDQEYTITKHIVDKQWDDASREAFVKDPQLIRALHLDVKNGVYDAVYPKAMKMKALDGGRRSDMDYYIQAGQAHFAEIKEVEAKQAAEVEKTEKVEKIQKRQAKQASVKKSAKKRKAAAVTKTGGSKKRPVTDWLSDDALSDEEFSKLMEKQIRS